MKHYKKHIKRHYKRIAAALAGAALVSAAVMPALPALPHPAAKPIADPPAPTAPVENIPSHTAMPPEMDAKKVVDVTATAYAPGPHDNDQWGSKTKLGTEVRPGVIAVDPRIIPLGSRVMIKYPDGTKEYAVAEDTGGAIKGHRIDVAKWTVGEAERFGIKPVRVYVLNDTPGGGDIAQTQA